MVLLEVCVESVESARRAVSCGADRLELCVALSQGGLTPTIGLLTRVKQYAKKIPVMCLIRCRSGNFNYSDEEIDVMIDDIERLKENGADGFVIGALTESKEIAVEACSRLRAACGSLPVTFHRAFDYAEDPIPAALRKVKRLDCERILSSGRKENVTAGLETLTTLVQEAQSLGISVMPGGGITPDNIGHIAMTTNARELHMSASMQEAHPLPGMGLQMTVEESVLRAAIEKLRNTTNNRKARSPAGLGE